MGSRFEQESERFPAEEVHPPVGIGGRGLEEVKVVKLGEALVDAAAETADGDDVRGWSVGFGARGVAEVVNGLGKVR